MAWAGLKRKLVLAFLLGVALIFTGCGGGGSSDGVVAGDPVTDPGTEPVSGTAVDVLFLVDVTGDSDAIEILRNNSRTILNKLNSPEGDMAFGVASFCDFPLNTWGDPAENPEDEADTAYTLLQPISTNQDQALALMSTLPTGSLGADEKESQLEALYQAATGAGRDFNGDGQFIELGEIEPASTGWRNGAMRVVVLMTNAHFHDSAEEPGYPGPTMTDTIAALQNADIRVIGLEVGNVNLPQLDRVASETGGAKRQIPSDGTGIADILAAAFESLNLK